MVELILAFILGVWSSIIYNRIFSPKKSEEDDNHGFGDWDYPPMRDDDEPIDWGETISIDGIEFNVDVDYKSRYSLKLLLDDDLKYSFFKKRIDEDCMPKIISTKRDFKIKTKTFKGYLVGTFISCLEVSEGNRYVILNYDYFSLENYE